jgi:predicted nucleic acid-binding protein
VFTIDASVWVNAESPAEPSHTSSRKLLDEVIRRGLPIVVPTLLPVELAGVIARTRGDFTLALAMATALIALPTVRCVGLDDSLARDASDLAARYRLRGADAVYAAVAVRNGCELVSLDKEHLSRLTVVVPTRTPADQLARL